MPKFADVKPTPSQMLLHGLVKGRLGCSDNGAVVSVLIDEEDRQLVAGYNWYASDPGYAYTFTYYNGIKKKLYLHRLLMDPTESQEIDHINRDPSDNRRANLRLVDRSANMQNVSHNENRSGFLGVSKHCSGKWRARLRKNYTVVHQSLHDTKLEAALAYDKAAKFHFGTLAKTNASLGYFADETNATDQRSVPNGVTDAVRLHEN